MLLGRLFHRGKLLLGGNSHYALRRGKGGATVTQLLWKKQRDEPAASPGSGARDVVVFLGQAGDAGREAGRDDILAVSPSVPRWTRVAHGGQGLVEVFSGGAVLGGGWKAMGRWEGASCALTAGRGGLWRTRVGSWVQKVSLRDRGAKAERSQRPGCRSQRLHSRAAAAPAQGRADEAALLPMSSAAAPLSIP